MKLYQEHKYDTRWNNVFDLAEFYKKYHDMRQSR